MSTPSTTPFRRATLPAALMAMALLVSACGDDEKSDEDAFCDAASSLEEHVSALGEMDVAAEGTDALKEAIGEIEDDLTALRDAGAEVAEAELDALNDSVDSLEGTVGDAAESPSADDVAAIVSGVGAAISAADAVVTTLQDACD